MFLKSYIALILAGSDMIELVDPCCLLVMANLSDVTYRVVSGDCVDVARHLSSQLMELERMIDHMMQEEFLHFCTHDLNRPITEHRTPADEVATVSYCHVLCC